MKEIIYCPQCKGEEVEVIDITPPYKPPRVSMDDLPDRNRSKGSFMNLIVNTIQTLARCKGCGYEKRWTEQR